MIKIKTLAFSLCLVSFCYSQPFQWTEPENLTSVDWNHCVSPSICLDSHNNIHIVYRYLPVEGPDELYYTWYNGEKWSEPDSLTSNKFLGSCLLKSDLLNQLHLIYTDNTGDFDRCFYMKKIDSTWTSPMQLSIDSLGMARHSDMIIDKENKIQIFWDSFDKICRINFDGKKWSEIQNILSSTTASLGSPKVVKDKNNNIHLIYRYANNEYANLHYIKYNGDQWSDPYKISNLDTFQISDYEMALDQENNPHVVWEQKIEKYGSDYKIFYTTFQNNKWNSPANLTNLDGKMFNPIIRINPITNQPLIIFVDATNKPFKTKYVYPDNQKWIINDLELNIETLSYDFTFDQSGKLHFTFSQNPQFVQLSDIYYSKGTIVTGLQNRQNPRPQNNLLKTFPNPFNSRVTIGFSIKKSQPVNISVFNILGKEVQKLKNNDYFFPGSHSIVWNGKNKYGKVVGSGIYYIYFSSQTENLLKKIIHLK